MLNQVIFVGRIAREPEFKELDNGKSVCNVTIAVQRSFKNSEGIYETDFLDCVLWNNVGKSAKEYCKVGDIIGVKGRVQTRIAELDGKKIKNNEIIAERVTFIQKGKEKEEELDFDVAKDNDIDI